MSNKIQGPLQNLQTERRLKPIMSIAQAGNCHSCRQGRGKVTTKARPLRSLGAK